MRINNNLTAINAHRNYGVNASGIGKNVEKLSSGYRINRAGDDAAGLAISEKMRAQIRGLTMASKNSQDAISLVQTAEGALQSAHNVLQRMRELAVQSASDTNETTVDRNALQQEFMQLIQEINDTASKTKFNDQSLIDGTFAKTLTAATTENSLVNFAWADDRLESRVYKVEFDAILAKAGVTATSGTSKEVGPGFNAVSINGPISVTFIEFDGTTGSVNGANNNGVWNVIVSGGKLVAENQRTGERIETLLAGISASLNGKIETTTITIGGIGAIKIDNLGSAPIDADSYVYITGQILVSGAVDKRDPQYNIVAILDGGEQIALETGQTTLNFKNSGISLQLKDALAVNTSTNFAGQTGGVFDETDPSIEITVAKGNGKALTIQAGANEGDNLQINLAKLDAYSLGIANANISNRMDASVAITQVNTALNIISTQRAALGALQNRLEYKISNLDIGAENLQAAESRIRDVDMAKEMTLFTRNNILFQASTAMLAQANALPQGVLQLLG